MARPFKCPWCSSNRTGRKGKRITKQFGIRQIWFCKKCKRKFTPPKQKPLE